MADEAFYSTAAQVLPILLLALVFEQRYFDERKDEPPARSLWFLTLLIALGGGELVAILALLEKEPTIFARQLVLFGVTLGTMALIVPLFASSAVALRTWLPDSLVVPLKYGALLVVVAVIVLTVVVDQAILSGAILGLFVLFTILTVVAEDLPGWRRWRGDREGRA